MNRPQVQDGLHQFFQLYPDIRFSGSLSCTSSNGMDDALSTHLSHGYFTISGQLNKSSDIVNKVHQPNLVSGHGAPDGSYEYGGH